MRDERERETIKLVFGEMRGRFLDQVRAYGLE